MRKIIVTTRSPEEIQSLFATVLKGVRPEAVDRPTTQADRLAPYRAAIVRERRRGYSWKQLAAAMNDPRISEPVSEQLLKRVFGAPAKPAVPVPPKPHPPHLVLDPLTGQRIYDPPPPAP